MMQRVICYFVLSLCIGWFLFSGSPAWSQESGKAEEQLIFPQTTEEIIEALGKMPADFSIEGVGALPSSGNDQSLFGGGGQTRGLGAIVEDEQALTEAPKAMALVLFDYDSAEIQSESQPLLELYGKTLQGELQDTVMVIAGHTDSIGSDEYNLLLSQKRAEAIKQFLVKEFEIGENRLLVKPYGESKPIADNATVEGRAKNRRVEFIRIQ